MRPMHYVAIPKEHRSTMPASLLPTLGMGNCAHCKRELVFHKGALAQSRVQAKEQGRVHEVICDGCLETELAKHEYNFLKVGTFPKIRQELERLTAQG